MANDLTQISVMVPESGKEEWKQAAADSEEYNSMSQLIRTAVGKEISGKYEGGGLERSDLQEELEERVSENLRSVEGILKTVQRQVGDIQENTEQQATVGRYTRLEVYSAIPKGEENALTFEELQKRLGDPFDPADIAEARDLYDEIESTSTDEGTKLYREE